MRRARFKFASIAGIAAVALLATACSSDAPKAQEESPLFSYMEAVYGGEDWTQEKYDEQHRLEQEYIAGCMTKQGFEYKPDMQNGGVIMHNDDFDDSEIAWGTLEFAEKYGYGAVESPYSDMVTGPSDQEEYFDPNADYIQSLSESEQEAYYEALWGPQPTEEEWAKMEEEDNWEWSPENQGCWGEANIAVSQDTGFNLMQDPEFENLLEAMQLLYESIDSDERLVTANTAWASCMAEAGYPGFTQVHDASSSFYDEWYNFTNSLNEGNDGSQEWKQPSQEEKDEYQKREIAMATSDFKCAEKSRVNDIYTEVQFELEEAFIIEHKAELDALVAKAQQNKK